MATAYTDLLGFALPVTGELNGTWGDVVNNSITELVEDSIANSATASVASGDWTLTTTGGGLSNQARCAILIPTGLPGVTRNIIAPAKSKAYVVVNQSNAAVVVKASGTTGATVAPGVNALVAWNGADFVSIGVSSLSGGSTGLTPSSASVGSLTLGGILNAPSGGTGQSTYAVGDLLYASTTSALSKLADVASGNALISGGENQPPAWGKIGLTTHVSGTLATSNGGTGSTSTAYCNLTSNVNGILPIANGGTGSSSTAYCSLTSNVAGTLPVANGGTGRTSIPAASILVANSANTYATVTPAAGQSVRLNSSGTAWEAFTPAQATGGTVTSVSGTGNVNGITLSGTVTTTGNIVLGGALSNVSLTTQVVGTLPVANGGTGVTSSTGSGSVVLSSSPTLTTPNIGTPSAGSLTNCTSLPIVEGTTGTLSVARGGTGVTVSTGSGSVVLSNSPTLVTPALGTPSSGTLTSCTGLPIVAGTTGTLSVARGGTGVTTSTGSGNVVLSTSPTLVTPTLGTPASGTLTNCSGLPLTTGVTGTLPVANGGTGVTSSTGSGSNVLSNTPTIVAGREFSSAVAASNIDLTSANYYSKTITVNTTFTVSNVASSGTVNSIILTLTNGGSKVINWWSGVRWASGSAPVLTASGVDVLGFFTTDGGSTWNGFVLGQNLS